jgi:hypothetical protein
VDFTGTDGCTVSTSGAAAISDMGARSRTGSKGSLGKRNWFTVSVIETVRIV